MKLLAAFDRFFYAAAPAERSAWLRILIGGYSLAYLCGRFNSLSNVTGFHALEFAPVGPVALLGAPLAAPWVFVCLLVAIALGVAFTLGWHFRVTGPAFAAFLLWVTAYRNSWGMKFHVENLMTLHVILLAGARTADDLSLDARRRGRVLDEHGRYGWAPRALSIVTVITYVLAGVAKLKLAGSDWLHGDYLRAELAHDNLRKIELGSGHSPVGAWLVTYTWPFGALAFLTLLIELGAPIALLGGRIALGWAALAWSFHLGVATLMLIVFPYPLFGFAFLPFFPLERWRWLRAIATRLRGTEQAQTSAPPAIAHATGLPPNS